MNFGKLTQSVEDSANQKAGQTGDAVQKSAVKAGDEANDTFGNIKVQAKEKVEEIVEEVKERAEGAFDSFKGSAQEEVTKTAESKAVEAENVAKEQASGFMGKFGF